MHEKTSKKYDFFAKAYDSALKHYSEKSIQMAIDAHELHPVATIYDAGCGTGTLELALKDKYPRLKIHACDISRGMMDQAMRKLEHLHDISLTCYDFVTAYLPEKFYDSVYSLSNLHYFPDPLAVLNKARYICKPEGKLILIDWERHSLRSRLYNAWMKRFDPGFNGIYTKKELETMLTQSGWEIESFTRFSIHNFWTMFVLVANRK